MEDLRKDYNVKKKRSFNISLFWEMRKKLIKTIAYIMMILFIITKPELIGSYVGKWINSLITSFALNSSITNNQWGIILITVLIIAISYKLIQWRRKN